MPFKPLSITGLIYEVRNMHETCHNLMFSTIAALWFYIICDIHERSFIGLYILVSFHRQELFSGVLFYNIEIIERQ